VQILIGERDVDDDLRLDALDERDHLRHVVGVHLRGADRPLDLRGDLAAFLLGAAGERDLGEHFRPLRALVRHHLADAARADDEYLGHADLASGDQSS